MKSFAGYLRLFSRTILIVFSVAYFAFALLSGADTYGGGLRGIIMNSPNALPWLLLLVISYVAFKWELVGGSLIILLGLFSIFFFRAFENLFVLFAISVPLILLGGFLITSRLLEKRDAN